SLVVMVSMIAVSLPAEVVGLGSDWAKAMAGATARAATPIPPCRTERREAVVILTPCLLIFCSCPQISADLSVVSSDLRLPRTLARGNQTQGATSYTLVSVGLRAGRFG